MRIPRSIVAPLIVVALIGVPLVALAMNRSSTGSSVVSRPSPVLDVGRECSDTMKGEVLSLQAGSIDLVGITYRYGQGAFQQAIYEEWADYMTQAYEYGSLVSERALDEKVVLECRQADVLVNYEQATQTFR